jgi:hypothetical protein
VGRLSVRGVTRDNVGAPLGTCALHLFLTADDTEQAIGTSRSDGYFAVYPSSVGPFYLVAYKVGSPDATGATLNTLVGT